MMEPVFECPDPGELEEEGLGIEEARQEPMVVFEVAGEPDEVSGVKVTGAVSVWVTTLPESATDKRTDCSVNANAG